MPEAICSPLSCRLLFPNLGPAGLLSLGNLLPRGGRELAACPRLACPRRCGMIPSQFLQSGNGLVQAAKLPLGAAPLSPQLRKRATEVKHDPPFSLTASYSLRRYYTQPRREKRGCSLMRFALGGAFAFDLVWGIWIGPTVPCLGSSCRSLTLAGGLRAALVRLHGTEYLEPDRSAPSAGVSDSRGPRST